MVLQLQNRGVQLFIVLHPAGQDEVTPNVFSMLFGIFVTELQGGTAYTMMQAHPHGTVAGVKMIRFDAFDVTGGIHQAITRVCGDGHSSAEIVHKETIGMPLAGVTPGLESIACHLEVTLYVLDEIMDLAGAIQVGVDSADHESHINVGNFLMPAVCLEHQENGGHPTYFRGPLRLRGHECTLGEEGAQTVEGEALHVECMYQGTEVDVPRLIPSWLWRVSQGIEPPSFSIRRMHWKLRAAI